MIISKELLHKKIGEWFLYNKRKLPWRETRNPYFVMVAEFMLQQTQVSRVLPKYLDFIERFPTIDSLSKAKASEVIKLWSGLGYNKRAINLHLAVKMIVKEFRGEFPKDINQLILLPGVGSYTASAIACFAFEKAVPVVDTNINRVFQRLICESEDKLSDKNCKELALKFLNYNDPWTWNQGVMEFGAVVCKTVPNCFNCIFASICTSSLNRTKRNESEHSIAKVNLRIKGQRISFEKSNRYFRGRLIKFLTLIREDSWISFKQAYGYIWSLNSAFDEDRFKELLRQLESEGLIQISKFSDIHDMSNIALRLPE